MAKKRKTYERPKRRFRKAVDGPEVMKWYAVTPTAELARRMGLTVKQIENHVYSQNHDPWAHKTSAHKSAVNRVNGKKGGRPRKKIEK